MLFEVLSIKNQRKILDELSVHYLMMLALFFCTMWYIIRIEVRTNRMAAAQCNFIEDVLYQLEEIQNNTNEVPEPELPTETES